MRAAGLACTLLPVAAVNAAKLLQSNDDGWAEINLRTFHNVLRTAGHNVVLSGPAENESARGSLDKDPTTLSSPCEYDSCPEGSPATGSNATDPRLNYVNSYPVTSVRYGLNTSAANFFDGTAPDLVLTGPNVGTNLDIQLPFSGTVGGASYAAHTAKVPAIAFSGKTGDPTAWNEETPLYSTVYADLAQIVTEHVLAGGAPYLPDDVFLNVNFPAVSEDSCNEASQFKFVLTRVNLHTPGLSDDDVQTCDRETLPREREVIDTDGCYVSISVGDAADKTTATADKQQVVLDKLGDLLTCLP
ncbi:uncharacterized protein K452DRAFT_220380 [Aplosporella prunicola CBS 121167]|uniref:Survival protein SurE-like phosphatase/nucleotidase domain-containing protein n=1 Tax=Aplosporella prunicola CBS 121167 TaxID=1176127 RepID=A0A6A6BQY5_9PEZI|nr:uncharacterized protein K452DRAFT_220380 [Aplosporella prunicola CBS 121167]KAF2145843.1 hypothetical protein K452DRAFT_220380 [Aplosporella prunicola CBS 121167]